MRESNGSHSHLQKTTVQASFHRLEGGKITLKVTLREEGKDGSGTSSTMAEIAIKGGLSAVERIPNERLAQAGATATLLHWTDARTDKPIDLLVTFR